MTEITDVEKAMLAHCAGLAEITGMLVTVPIGAYSIQLGCGVGNGDMVVLWVNIQDPTTRKPAPAEYVEAIAVALGLSGGIRNIEATVCQNNCCWNFLKPLRSLVAGNKMN